MMPPFLSSSLTFGLTFSELYLYFDPSPCLISSTIHYLPYNTFPIHHHPTSDSFSISWCFFPVGGGTSGAVFASRLAEEEDKTILLLEAGGDPTNDPNINIPIFADSVRGTEFDWQYRTVPQKDACKGHIDGVRRKSIKYISINIGPYLVLI